MAARVSGRRAGKPGKPGKPGQARRPPRVSAQDAARGRGGALPAFLAACRRERVSHRPVWIMRQAGRYLPEYRALRAKVDFETLTCTPELAAEVTLQPLRRFPLDAAILFSDIMTPLQGMGVELRFEPGPIVSKPIRSEAQIEALPALVPTRDVPFVLDTIRLVRAAAPRGVPLIGFAGAPFTLLCYLVCGRPSKEFAAARTFLYAQPRAAQQLLARLADAMAAYLAAQAGAGAQALMLFESWAGLLGPREYARFVLPAVKRTAAALRPLGVPLIYYANQGATLLPAIAGLDVDVIGVDWRSDLSQVRRILGPGKAVQGNLDPAALFAPPEELRRLAAAVIHEAGSAPGHIFNLGHGIWPDTDPDAVARLVDFVHEH
jgi:uroporphyrinogen decarboxylase